MIVLEVLSRDLVSKIKMFQTYVTLYCNMQYIMHQSELYIIYFMLGT